MDELRQLLKQTECVYCGVEGFKNNGKAELICENRARTGKCTDSLGPYQHTKQHVQQNNDLCMCKSGKKYKKCCKNKEI